MGEFFGDLLKWGWWVIVFGVLVYIQKKFFTH